MVAEAVVVGESGPPPLEIKFTPRDQPPFVKAARALQNRACVFFTAFTEAVFTHSNQASHDYVHVLEVDQEIKVPELKALMSDVLGGLDPKTFGLCVRARARPAPAMACGARVAQQLTTAPRVRAASFEERGFEERVRENKSGRALVQQVRRCSPTHSPHLSSAPLRRHAIIAPRLSAGFESLCSHVVHRTACGAFGACHPGGVTGRVGSHHAHAFYT